ncbi:MAG: hypothetical protein HWQ38_37745 [Nostoc sp. NMS7]|uniref:hypothetical protein n=1 Tax=Nostoc sp. NMS7 TaxID=2815391 RepID=UPI0025DCAC5F|nr:hypothetical protein [Nostoc sp. NMS7]MBN3951901.1 hypothetical protein [Nostoc sp. NMS7]
MNTKIIYHNIKPDFPCPDGISAAWVAAKVYSDAELIGWQYQSEELPAVENFDRLIIVDFSFPKEVLQQWSDMECPIVVIDHHKTAQKMLEGFAGGILKFDMSKCGAVLTWELFFPNQPIPVFLEYVQDQDLWQWKLPHSEAVREAFAVLWRSFELFDQLEPMNQQEFLDYMVPIGQPRLDEKRKKVEAIALRHEWQILAGYSIPVVALVSGEERYRSDVCAWLYKEYPEAPFSASYRIENGVEHWDLRSDKDGNNFDVSAIATQFNGGGHHNAAGFSRKVEEDFPW